jgi:hypothetical protein
MGTRADFYIKRESNYPEWIGSISWDGYDIRETTESDSHKSDRNMSCYRVKQARTEEEYKEALEAYFSFRDDVRLPKDGWPWPWDDSCTTDKAYVFDVERGKVRMFAWGREYASEEDKEAGRYPNFNWPDMTDNKNVADGGFIVFKAL